MTGGMFHNGLVPQEPPDGFGQEEFPKEGRLELDFFLAFAFQFFLVQDHRAGFDGVLHRH